MSEQFALLQTDIVDSTRLNERLGDSAMLTLWIAHDRLARDLLPEWRGREIDRTDGFLLQFTAASDAVGYALAYHHALASLSVPVKARAGLHVGPLSTRENCRTDVALGARQVEVDGLAISTTTRVMSLAQGGQTLLTAQAKAALGVTTLKPQSHGHWRLKGLEEPFELFEVGDADAPFTPPPDSAKVYGVVHRNDLWLPRTELRHTLLAERDGFIGRKAELQDLARRFHSGSRLVSVIGTGGTGKTRLAQRFGWTWLGDFRGGVWFCDVSQVNDVDGIVGAVARGLEVPLGRGDPIAQIGSALAGRGACLVIIDNFEQVTRYGESTIGSWLNVAREACFLVTSREVLGIVGEETLALPPLFAGDAEALFRRRAVAATQNFRPTADDDVAIGSLVEMLDGLPLAIELAAARVRVMPPRMLLKRMSERFQVLSTRGGRPGRQATLRATFDWSWQLLSEPEKVALAQLSVFEGGFTLAAAEALLDVSSFDAPTPLDLVQSLVDKSLVRQMTPRRLGMLRSLQEYAAQHLSAPGHFTGSGPSAEQAAHSRHSRYFASLDEKSAVEDGCVEIANLIVACRRAAAASDAFSATGALAGSWEALKLQGPFGAAVDLAATVSGISSLNPAQRAIVDWVAGSALQQLGKVAEARNRFCAGLALARSVRACRTEAHLLCSLSELLRIEGGIEPAKAYLIESFTLGQRLEDRRIQLKALNGLGALYEHQGQLDESQAHYEKALSLARELLDRRAEGGLVGNIGSLNHNRGNLDEARVRYEQAAILAKESGDRKWESNVRCNLGLLHHDQGNFEQARTHLEEALLSAKAMGNARLECAILCNLGIVLEAQNSLEESLAHYVRAVSAANVLGDRRSEGQFRGYLGLLYARLKRFPESTDCLAVGEALLSSVADNFSLALLLCSAAEAHLLAGNRDEAIRSLDRVSPLARSVGAGPASELGKKLFQLQTKLGCAALSLEQKSLN